MKNRDNWRSSKFELTPGGLRSSRDPAAVVPSSRFVTDHLAPQYEALLVGHARGRLLDLGCGSAPLYGVYQRLVADAVCVDWPNSAYASDYVDVEADLNGPLPFSDQEFDTVLLTDVLEHILEPVVLFGEIARLLRPGGKLLLTTPFFYWIHEEPRDFARYTSYMLEHFCKAQGLRVLELRATGGSPEVLLDLVGKHLAPFAPLASAYATAVPWLLKLPGVRRLSSKSQRWFPLGFILVAERAA